jgi:hypothetical protein
VAEAAVRLEEKPRSSRETPEHIQEDFSRRPMIESRLNPSRLLTQLGSLLEQLRRMQTP